MSLSVIVVELTLYHTFIFEAVTSAFHRTQNIVTLLMPSMLQSFLANRKCRFLVYDKYTKEFSYDVVNVCV